MLNAPLIFMHIILYKTNSAPNVIGKSLSDPKSIIGTLRQKTDVINPYIEIATNPTEYNYCYIQELQRYYFISDYALVRNGIFGLRLNIDVLETYKTQIKAGTADLVSSDAPSYSSNSDYVTDVRNVIKKIDFNYTFKKSNDMVLITLVG